MIRGIIDDLRKTLSELREKLQSAGFANAETLVPQHGVGRSVVYAFCEMHNKCTKCTTDILRNKSQMRKTARKTGGSASSQHANAGVNTTLESSQETTEKTTGKTAEKTLTVSERMFQAIKNDPRITMTELAEKLGLTQDGVYYNIKELRAEVGLHREGGRKLGRWVIGT